MRDSVGCGCRVAGHVLESSNSSKASASITWRAEGGVEEDGVPLGASRCCGRCCAVDAEVSVGVLGVEELEGWPRPKVHTMIESVGQRPGGVTTDSPRRVPVSGDSAVGADGHEHADGRSCAIDT